MENTLEVQESSSCLNGYMKLGLVLLLAITLFSFPGTTGYPWLHLALLYVVKSLFLFLYATVSVVISFVFCGVTQFPKIMTVPNLLMRAKGPRKGSIMRREIASTFSRRTLFYSMTRSVCQSARLISHAVASRKLCVFTSISTPEKIEVFAVATIKTGRVHTVRGLIRSGAEVGKNLFGEKEKVGSLDDDVIEVV